MTGVAPEVAGGSEKVADVKGVGASDNAFGFWASYGYDDVKVGEVKALESVGHQPREKLVVAAQERDVVNPGRFNFKGFGPGGFFGVVDSCVEWCLRPDFVERKENLFSSSKSVYSIIDKSDFHNLGEHWLITLIGLFSHGFPGVFFDL